MYTGQDRSTKTWWPQLAAHGMDAGLLAKKNSHGAEPPRDWDWESLPELEEAAVAMVWMTSLKANTSVGGESTWARHVGHEYSGDRGRYRNNNWRKAGIHARESSGCRDIC